MKTLTDQFIETRNRPQSVGTKIEVYLSEHELDGTQLNEYDITNYLNGGLPLIEKEVEKYFNAFVTGESTLKFFDPAKYIDTILNQTNRKFGMKILINLDFIEPAPIGDFIALSQTSRSWRDIAVAPNGNAYAVVTDTGRDIYKQTGGSGNFVALSAGYRQWYCVGAAPNGNVYAGVTGGDIYKQTGGVGSFVALGQTSRAWYDIAGAPNGDIYACVMGKDIYKQTGGVGDFVGLGQAHKNWTGIAPAPNGDVYACVFSGNIYKQTNGIGDFISLNQIVRKWNDITADIYGNIYACVDGGGIYKQTGGVGNFISLGQTSRQWHGISGAPNGSVYACVVNGDIYKADLTINEPLILFDGIVDIQRETRKGRNEFFITAQTWEKELEQYNAGLVFDADNMPFRNITGINIYSISGGNPGIKRLTYKNKSDQAGNLYEFQYEDGPSIIVTGSQLIELNNKEGDQTLTINFVAEYALEEDAEDVFIVGKDANGVLVDDIGYWYQAEDIATIVGKLLDTSTINIVTQDIDVNDAIAPLDKKQFIFFHKTYNEKIPFKTTGAKTQYKSLTAGHIFVHGIDVFFYVWDKDNLSFSKTHKFTVTTYMPYAIFVEKILTDNYGNHFLICVSNIEQMSDNEEWSSRFYYKTEGIVKVDQYGNYVEHWTNLELYKYLNIPVISPYWILAKSFCWTSILATGKLAYAGFDVFSEHIMHLGVLVFDTNTGTVIAHEERAVAAEGTEYGQGIAIKWNYITEEIDEFWCVEYRNDEQKTRLIWDRPQLGTTWWKEIIEMNYASADIYGQFQSKDGGYNWCLYSKPGEASEERRQFFFTFDVSSTTFPTEYWTGIAVSNILNFGAPPFGYVGGWRLDDAGFQESIVEINIGTVGHLPTFEIIQSGFLGSEYKMYSSPYRDSSDWVGVSTAGYSNTLIVWSITNIGKNIIFIADFTDMNVREALNEIAVLMCYWKRPERDKALFYSRGNYNDTAELDWDAYAMDDKNTYIIEKTKPYIGVEVSNPLYSQYTYRYPDNYNNEEGEALKLSNRFISPINGYIIAKLLADWHGQIRRIASIPAWFRIELEELDRILWKLYDIDGNLEEQIYMVLTRISYDNKTQLTELRAVEIEGVPLETVLFKPHHFGVSA